MASTGLKVPCFCGREKKYKNCCFLKDMQEVLGKGRSSPGSRLKEKGDSQRVVGSAIYNDPFFPIGREGL